LRDIGLLFLFRYCPYYDVSRLRHPTPSAIRKPKVRPDGPVARAFFQPPRPPLLGDIKRALGGTPKPSAKGLCPFAHPLKTCRTRDRSPEGHASSCPRHQCLRAARTPSPHPMSCHSRAGRNPVVAWVQRSETHRLSPQRHFNPLAPTLGGSCGGVIHHALADTPTPPAKRSLYPFRACSLKCRLIEHSLEEGRHLLSDLALESPPEMVSPRDNLTFSGRGSFPNQPLHLVG